MTWFVMSWHGFSGDISLNFECGDVPKGVIKKWKDKIFSTGFERLV